MTYLKKSYDKIKNTKWGNIILQFSELNKNLFEQLLAELNLVIGDLEAKQNNLQNENNEQQLNLNQELEVFQQQKQKQQYEIAKLHGEVQQLKENYQNVEKQIEMAQQKIDRNKQLKEKLINQKNQTIYNHQLIQKNHLKIMDDILQLMQSISELGKYQKNTLGFRLNEKAIEKLLISIKQSKKVSDFPIFKNKIDIFMQQEEYQEILEILNDLLKQVAQESQDNSQFMEFIEQTEKQVAKIDKEMQQLENTISIQYRRSLQQYQAQIENLQEIDKGRNKMLLQLINDIAKQEKKIQDQQIFFQKIMESLSEQQEEAILAQKLLNDQFFPEFLEQNMINQQKQQQHEDTSQSK